MGLLGLECSPTKPLYPGMASQCTCIYTIVVLIDPIITRSYAVFAMDSVPFLQDFC